MTDPVKPRSYDASGRRSRAAASRLRILATARELLLAGGYRATTVASVARAAGVSPETVYGVFGSKLGLLKVALDVAIAGDDRPIPVADRPPARALDAEPDAAAALGIYAAAVGETNVRTAPLLRVLHDAAAADAEAAVLLADLDAQRLRGMTMAARALTAKGGFRADADEVRDVLWTLNSPDVYDLLVTRRGWPVPAYVRWLTTAWCATLLGPDSVGGRS